MSDILTNAVSGLNQAASRIANVSSSIVNGTSTKNISRSVEKDIATNLIALKADKVQFEANAKVVKAAEKLDKTTLDISV